MSSRISGRLAAAGSLVLVGALGLVGAGSAQAAIAYADPAARAAALHAAEIDRVLAEGRSVTSASTLEARVAAAVRCADFSGERYCLNVGWTTRTEAEVRDEAVADVRFADLEAAGEETGDLSVSEAVAQAAALPAKTREARERRELVEAVKGLRKVRELRAELATPRMTSTALTPYPEQGSILDPARTTEQIRTYYCGPTSMQMIHWNWNNNERVTQDTWASRLGTTTSGSAITELVRVTNAYTGWDNEAYAGTYITLDIGDHTFTQWFNLNAKHYSAYRAPIILHPILLKQFYPYLDDDGSGHFQVGRGWDYNSDNDSPKTLSFFEPWNQQRFNSSEPFIPRVQWRNAIDSYNANQAHSMHNLGL